MTTQTDLAGTQYISPDNKPAPSGASVQVSTSNGTVPGTMVGPYAVPNK